MKRKQKEVYPSDLTDAQWQVAALALRKATRQPGKVPRREILNAIFYVQRTGCQWRYLPKSYPNWKTVYSCFWRWQRNGVWDRVLEALRPQVRVEGGKEPLPTAAGKEPLPTAAVIDSQSVKTTEKGGHEATMEPIRWSQKAERAQAFCPRGHTRQPAGCSGCARQHRGA